MSSYPTTLDTEASLLVAANNWSTQLLAAITPTTVDIPIASTAGLQPTEGLISIGDEVLRYSFIEDGGGYSILRDCTRGYDGTIAVSHGAASRVELRTVAAHHNRLSAAVRAVQQALGEAPQGGAASLAERLLANLPAVHSFSPAVRVWEVTHNRGRVVGVQLWRLVSPGTYEQVFAPITCTPDTVSVDFGIGAVVEGFMVVM